MAIANASEGDRAAESPHVHMGISDVTYFDRGTHTVNNQIATQPFRTKSSVSSTSSPRSARTSGNCSGGKGVIRSGR